MNLKEMLYPEVDASAQLEFKRYTLKENFDRIKFLAFAVIIIESILGLSAVISYFFLDNLKFHYGIYLSLYALMIAVNIFMLVCIYKTGSLADADERKLKKLNDLLLTYITYMLLWGSVVTLLDQVLYVQLTVYVVNLIACCMLCNVNTNSLMVPFLLSAGVLMAGLPFFQHSTDVLIGHYINLTIFIVISFICSRLLYCHHCYSFNSRIKLGKAHDEQRRLSFTDELTSLPNRRSYSQYIEANFISSLKPGIMVSVIMLDIDCFKKYNDFYGHMSGDAVLVQVAKEIDLAVDKFDTFAARIGGEEFICIAKYKTATQFSVVAEKLRKKISDLQILHEGSEHGYVTVSMGISEMTLNRQEDIYTCIHQADKALYFAKQSGKNCIKLYENEMTKAEC